MCGTSNNHSGERLFEVVAPFFTESNNNASDRSLTATAGDSDSRWRRAIATGKNIACGKNSAVNGIEASSATDDTVL